MSGIKKNEFAYLTLSVLRSMGASCPNRGEDGSPKTLMFGGVDRPRWSSAAQKIKFEKIIRTDPRFAEVRKYFQSDLTMKIAESLAGKLMVMGLDSQKADELAAAFDSEVFRKPSENKKAKVKEPTLTSDAINILAAAIFEAKGSLGEEKEKELKVPNRTAFTKKVLASLTEAVIACGGAKKDEAEKMVGEFYKLRPLVKLSDPALFRISQMELEWIANKIKATDSGTFGVSAAAAVKMLNGMLTQKHSDGMLDELTGRMNACTGYQQDSKMYVAHAIATHGQSPETDYFTAMDRLGDSRSAAHIGTSEFSSTVMYECFVINMRDLFAGYSFSEDIKRQIVSAVVLALISAIPSGRQSTMFSDTETSYAHAMAWNAAPLTMINAFQENEDAGISHAIKALKTHADKMVASYADERSASQIAEFTFGEGSTVKFANEVANAFTL